ELLAGNLYVNVHTSANPGGEIRGQVNVSAGTGFSASLNGDQENPPVTTSASGTGAFTLTEAGLVFDVTVEGLDFTAAHFHNEAVGANGPVVRGITDDFVGNTASGVWTSTDAQPLNNELIRELVSDNIYVNVHTAANPGGEIRGQLSAVEIVTSVEPIDGTSGIPREFSLSQNFPNPFNPTTEIRFDLKQSGPTVLKIYNMLGQEVATLVDENMPAGSYKVTFESNTLPSGVYIYRLQSSGLSEARKMILLR
nr:CHRD domain-containing protein [candidate division KSB1 bacterium]NIR72590.1 CHRD domain-containing protein [candidate division KSB1 bacterium]NIS23650.1 CHRD domain-containing protein [candidate division KSB1 bacterium]NIT70574.1 CHRD domain-containing protein [candidate division KSB1 bacterium]NIU24292.1 CHRD domain-containing protein [candidate division KSB1 bacterium]